MYAQHFGFTSLPFNRAVPAEEIFPGRPFLEAHYGLRGGIDAGYRRMLLTGEPGVGKTTVLRWLQASLEDDGYRVVRPVIQATASEEARGAAADAVLAPAHGARADDADTAACRGIAVIVDDAHLLREADLAAVLAQCSVAGTAPLHATLILAGAPALEELLADAARAGTGCAPDLVCRMQPMHADDADAYIHHKLEKVGNRNPDVFDHAAIVRIVEFSHGLPKRIDDICGMALLIACDAGRTAVAVDMVNEAIEDLEGADRKLAAVGPVFADPFDRVHRTPTANRSASPAGALAVRWRRALQAGAAWASEAGQAVRHAVTNASARVPVARLRGRVAGLRGSVTRWHRQRAGATEPRAARPVRRPHRLAVTLGFAGALSVASLAAVFALIPAGDPEAPGQPAAAPGRAATASAAQVEPAGPAPRNEHAALVEENRRLQTALTQALKSLHDRDEIVARQRTQLDQLHAQVTAALARLEEFKIASATVATPAAPAAVKASPPRARPATPVSASAKARARRDEVPTHKVVAGDTLYSLARRFDVSVDQLRQWNGLQGNRLLVGQSLHVAPRKPAQPAVQLLSAVTAHGRAVAR